MDNKFTFSEGSWYGTKIKGSKYKMTAISIPEECLKDNYKVNTIEIFNKGIRYFPKGLGDFFPRLKILKVTHCQLESLSREDLAGLESIEELNLTGNRITSLPDDLFNGMDKLKRISFRDNFLEELSPKLLLPIMKHGLELVDFRDNRKVHHEYYNIHPSYYPRYKFMQQVEDEYQQHSRKVPSLKIESFQNDFCAHLAELRSSGRMTDFTIIAGGTKELRVHKTVLAVQSPVFAAMFESGMSEQTTGKITITDFSAEAIEQFIDCLYTGEIENADNAMELFGLAAKYDVPKLKAASKHNMMMSTNKANAFEVFEFGHLHSEPEIQRKAFDSIKQTMPNVEFDENLMDDPEGLGKLLKAIDKRDKRIRAAEKMAEHEIAALCKKST